MQQLRNWVATAKKRVRALVKSGSSPHSIALGFSVGTFIAMMPTPGLNIALGFLVAFLFRNKMNRLALFGAIFLWNPLITLPLAPIGYKIGGFLFPHNGSVDVSVTLFRKVFHFTQKFLVGITILSMAVSLVSYGIIRLLAEVYLRRVKHRLIHRIPSPDDSSDHLP